MQRLEEIKLELGDKCTLSDGTFDYINIEDLNRFENLGLLLIDCNVIKLERYVQCNDIIDNPTNLYELVTIWERKEILDKEKLQKELSKIQSELDISNNEISHYHSKMHSARDRIGYLKEQLKEIQKKLNSME